MIWLAFCGLVAELLGMLGLYYRAAQRLPPN